MPGCPEPVLPHDQHLGVDAHGVLVAEVVEFLVDRRMDAPAMGDFALIGSRPGALDASLVGHHPSALKVRERIL